MAEHIMNGSRSPLVFFLVVPLLLPQLSLLFVSSLLTCPHAVHAYVPTADESVVSTTRGVAVASIVESGRGGKTQQTTTAFPLQRLEDNASFQALDQRDRSFAKMMVLTTMRRIGQIDKVIGMCRKEKMTVSAERHL